LNHAAILKAPGAQIALNYQHETFEKAARNTLSRAGTLGYDVGLALGPFRMGFGADIGFAHPNGHILQDTVAIENRNVSHGDAYLSAGIIVPLWATYLEPYVNWGYSGFDLVADPGPPQRDFDLGDGGYMEYGLKTAIPIHHDDAGIIGVGLGLGKRRYSNGGTRHYDGDSNIFQLGFVATGWLIHGK
jgi:hypothetical protein